jgi:peptide/nickel transport system permease protein
MALSNYLAHSVVCTLFFYGYGLGLYGSLGPAITIVLTLIIYRTQISSSKWWLARYRFGPLEWLWRSLTYGKFQPLAAERQDARRSRETLQQRKEQIGIADQSEDARGLSDGLIFVLRRLALTFSVGFAIVYFCMLGLSLTTNSTTSVNRTRTVGDMAAPAFDETIAFFGDAVRGDLGYVTQGVTQVIRVPVADILADTFARSASLLAVSIGAAATLGVVAGGLAATRRHSPLSLSTLTLTVVGVSIPSFFLALLLRIADIKFYQRTGLGLFPAFGISVHRTDSLLPQVVAPALVLAARPLAHVTRVTFVTISEVLNRDYIRTARAKGLGPSVVFWKHTLRNAGVSILTAIVVSLRFALGSLPVVEIFFDWPGLGVTMLNGIYERDSPVVSALALSLGVTFLLITLAADLIYRLIDPRLRVQTNGDEQ